MTFPFHSPLGSLYDGLNSGLPQGAGVTLKKCGCAINCRAIALRASTPGRTRLIHLPRTAVIVTCRCCWAAYRYKPAEIFKNSPGGAATVMTVEGPRILINKEEKKTEGCPSHGSVAYRRGAAEQSVTKFASCVP